MATNKEYSAEEIAARAKTVPEVEVLIENAMARGREDVARAARRRLIELLAAKHGAAAGSLAQDAYATIYAYQQAVLGGRYAGRTWQMVKKYGVVDTVERLVRNKKPSTGYTKLVEAGLHDLAFEALVLKYPENFRPDTVEAARKRTSEDTTGSW